MAVLECPRCDVQWGKPLVPADQHCWVCGDPSGVEPGSPKRYDLCHTCRGLITADTRRWCSPRPSPGWADLISRHGPDVWGE